MGNFCLFIYLFSFPAVSRLNTHTHTNARKHTHTGPAASTVDCDRALVLVGSAAFQLNPVLNPPVLKSLLTSIDL